MNNRRSILATVLALLLILVFGSVIALAGGYTLRVGMGEDMPDSLDTWTWNTTARMAMWNIYEGLVTMTHESTQPKPALAKSWDISGTRYTFYLEKGVTFTDGTPFDADAVAFNIQRTNGIGLGPSRFLVDVKDVKVVDAYTIEFELNNLSAGFLTSLYAVRMVSPTAVDEHKTANDPWARDWFNDHAVGTGPYKLDEWVRNQYIHLVRNDSYYRPFDGTEAQDIYIVLAKEPATQRAMLETGDLDIAPKITTDDAFTLKSSPNIHVEFIDTPVTYQLILNVSKGITSNLLIRRALNYCFDSKAYAELRGGIPGPLDGPFLPMFMGGQPVQGLMQYTYDIEKAKELVASSGYSAADLKLDIAMTPEIVPEHEASLTVLQEGLRKIGIQPVVHRLPWPTITEMQSKVDTSFGLIFYFAASADGTASAVGNLLFNSAGIGYRNLGQYRSDVIDDLLYQGSTTADPTARYKLETLAARIIVEDAAAIFVSQRAIPLVYRSWLEEIDWYPLENYIFNFFGFHFNEQKAPVK